MVTASVWSSSCKQTTIPYLFNFPDRKHNITQGRAMSFETDSNSKTSGEGTKMTDRTYLIGQNHHTETTGLINRENSFRSAAEIFENLIRPSLVEFIGTAVFVFIGTTAVCFAESVAAVAVAHGLAIAVLVASIGAISGGHFNPAVTVGVLIGGGIGPVQAVLYFVSQIIGGILGAAFTLGVVGGHVYDLNKGGGHTLGQDTYAGEGFLCEVLLTYLLVTVVLAGAVDISTKSSLGPFAIGCAVLVDILAGADISGASMNPARSFGPAVVVHDSELWSYHWVYWVGPGIGSIIAGVTYRFILAGPEKRIAPRFLRSQQ